MKPTEAGFDGEKGISLNIPGMMNGVYKIRRGSTPPWMTPSNYKNQLMWQQTTPPRLLFCNSNNEWFELDFIPINT